MLLRFGRDDSVVEGLKRTARSSLSLTENAELLVIASRAAAIVILAAAAGVTRAAGATRIAGVAGVAGAARVARVAGAAEPARTTGVTEARVSKAEATLAGRAAETAVCPVVCAVRAIDAIRSTGLLQDSSPGLAHRSAQILVGVVDEFPLVVVVFFAEDFER